MPGPDQEIRERPLAEGEMLEEDKDAVEAARQRIAELEDAPQDVKDRLAEMAETVKPGPSRATADDFGPEDDAVPLTLPVRGLEVFVRILEGGEVAFLSRLPNLASWVDLMVEGSQALREARAKAEEAGQDGPTLNDVVGEGRMAIEEDRYLTYVVHLSVVDPDADPRSVPCVHCTDKGGWPLEHRPSLLTPNQASRMSPMDKRAVGSVALMATAVGRLDPSSAARTPAPTAPSAGTGE
jgi:hypothetical protein